MSVKPGSSTSGIGGKRQYWYYTVRYAGGGEYTFPMKCEPIRIEFPENLLGIVDGLTSQKFNGPLCSLENRDTTLDSVRKMLTARGGMFVIYKLIKF